VRRVCVLTGAGGTLGSAFCRAYAGQYDIVAVCRRRRPDAVSQLESYIDPLAPAAALPENDARVYVVYADLEAPTDIDRVVDVALARYGRVDLLVNNAVYVGLHPHGLVDGEGALRDFARQFDVNVGVPLRLAAGFAQRFWKQHDQDNRAANRNIVNVSSWSASKVYPHTGQAVYSASKAALNQLTRHMAAEFAAFGVRVNALAPNSFPSLVSTESVARAIIELDGGLVTGRILALDATAAQAPTG
jgi:NAD(P)-dependent dehydrogenase (short-subunit alcohol dehydrogenase family)